MCEIDQQDEAYKKKEDGANKSDIVSPGNKEAVRDQEGDDNQAQPGNELGTPEAVLDGRSLVARVVDANEQQRQDEMEKAQGEVDAMDSDETIAFLAVARDGGKVKQHLLQLLDSPVGQHDPRQQRVEQENDGVCDSGRHRVVAFAAGTAHGRACRGAAA